MTLFSRPSNTLPTDEEVRLQAVHALNLIDTPAEARFDRITQTTSRLFNIPMVFIALVDSEWIWFKSQFGFSGLKANREQSFCNYTLQKNDILVVPDALDDERFVNNIYVTGEPHIRFYAGCPVRSRDGNSIGTLCLVDFQPRFFTAEECEALIDLAGWVESEVHNTELTHLLQLHEEKEQRQALVFENMYEAVVITDTKGKIIDWNRSAEKMIGVSRDEVIGKNVSFTYAEGPLDRISIMEQIGEKGRWYGERQFKRVDNGNLGICELAIGSLTDADGNITGFVSVARDISEKKQVESELIHAREEVIHASRLKSEFLSNMSHEIRTPLNGILGMIEVLGGTELTPEQREMTHIIRSSGETLLTLFDEILDFSRIEAGKLVLHSVSFNIREMFQTVISMLTAKALKKKLMLTAVVDEQVPDELYGDPTKLGQILINLIDNAIKFTAKGEISAQVSVNLTKGNVIEIRFAVADTGIGIADEAIKGLFQPFRQVNGTHARQYGGVGLGLALCKRLVDLMNGQIEVESVIGVGSKFSFVVPLTVSKLQVEEHSSVESNYSSHRPSTPQKKYRVLLVEDNEINQRLAQLQLDRLGYDSDAANSGFMAVEMFEQSIQSETRHSSYDLLLMDCQMPDMDGFETTRRIRKREQELGLHTPIVALTANATEQDRLECIAAGMDDYLAKPFSMEQLTVILYRWMEARDKQKASETSNSEIKAAQSRITREVPNIEQLPVLDMSTLDKLRTLLGRGQVDALRESIDIFLKNSAQLLRNLQNGFAQQNIEEVRRAAHTLKSNSASYGGARVSSLCATVEKIARSGTLVGVQELLPQLETEYNQLTNALISQQAQGNN